MQVATFAGFALLASLINTGSSSSGDVPPSPHLQRTSYRTTAATVISPNPWLLPTTIRATKIAPTIKRTKQPSTTVYLPVCTGTDMTSITLSQVCPNGFDLPISGEDGRKWCNCGIRGELSRKSPVLGCKDTGAVIQVRTSGDYGFKCVCQVASGNEWDNVSTAGENDTKLLGARISAVESDAVMTWTGSEMKKKGMAGVCMDGGFLWWSGDDCAYYCSCKGDSMSCDHPSDCGPNSDVNAVCAVSSTFMCQCLQKNGGVVAEDNETSAEQLAHISKAPATMAHSGIDLNTRSAGKDSTDQEFELSGKFGEKYCNRNNGQRFCEPSQACGHIAGLRTYCTLQRQTPERDRDEHEELETAGVLSSHPCIVGQDCRKHKAPSSPNSDTIRNSIRPAKPPATMDCYSFKYCRNDAGASEWMAVCYFGKTADFTGELLGVVCTYDKNDTVSHQLSYLQNSGDDGEILEFCATETQDDWIYKCEKKAEAEHEAFEVADRADINNQTINKPGTASVRFSSNENNQHTLECWGSGIQQSINLIYWIGKKLTISSNFCQNNYSCILCGDFLCNDGTFMTGVSLCQDASQDFCNFHEGPESDCGCFDHADAQRRPVSSNTPKEDPGVPHHLTTFSTISTPKSSAFPLQRRDMTCSGANMLKTIKIGGCPDPSVAIYLNGYYCQDHCSCMGSGIDCKANGQPEGIDQCGGDAAVTDFCSALGHQAQFECHC